LETILSGVFTLMDRLLPFAFVEPAFMKRALLALLLTAPAAAALGVPLVQHRMAFFSDAIGHSAFTGVALGVLLGISPSWTMVAFGVLVAVAITLVNAGSLEGDIFITLPEGRRRPKDFFNHSPTFFPLFTEQYIVYINRHFVASAQEPPQEKT